MVKGKETTLGSDYLEDQNGDEKTLLKGILTHIQNVLET
jgi:hypothetical protein